MEHVDEQIQTGDLPLESTLLSEPDLTHRYGVAINTVRRAIRHLWEQGTLEAVPAKVTFGIAAP
ncbi:GntR family transcriptional regulator [Streptomyces sp. NBC_01321]|uniref:GntR family transcriptional regulator n=1 Tax=Streptomyces sp. NBC_01321 TaxID=2903825 RepID=UPI002E1302AB|nr:GntR family transcriptional regulator [Streptomyces sp. NBC_01321]